MYRTTLLRSCQVNKPMHFFFLSPGILYGPYNHSKRDNLALCWIDSLPPYDNYRVRTLSKVY